MSKSRDSDRDADDHAGIEHQFFRAFSDNDDPRVAAVELLPSRLAQACVAVLPVAGVGLSVFSTDFRVPLGASGLSACDAERLQFTYGEGPCLRAHLGGEPVRANANEVEASWPLLYDDLITHTPFRSVIALPLRRVSPGQAGALDLYFTGPTESDDFNLDAAKAVAEEIVDILLLSEANNAPDELPGPAWMHGPEARHRMQVWVAIGMVHVALQRHDDDVLALLRAYAYSHGETLDGVAQAVLDRRLPIASLTP